jgi:hydrogenase-1 operon protein HyaF
MNPGARDFPRLEGGAAMRMECKVCWYVYDPAAGDAAWQVPPGTPWCELPSHWTCPTCSATRDGFLAVTDE